MKRLIVLCDGSCLDGLSGEIGKDPTNVIRFSRALNPYAIVNDEKVSQIVHYIPGVGTQSGSFLRGGGMGVGLSANVRAGYGFLAHNYSPGDEIFLFGFSRAAYTVRSIAGIVTYLGLLTKRGMDRFPDVYDEYYKNAHDLDDPDFSQCVLSQVQGEIHAGSKGAIKIIGVGDTVATHLGGKHGEKVEFYNQRLSNRVACGYHALALDERRKLYSPVLWEGPVAAHQEVIQAWFSGSHSDVGGGTADPRLSDISLAWMIARCAHGNKLSFNDVSVNPLSSYLVDHARTVPKGQQWGTNAGPTKDGDSGIWWLMNTVQARWVSGDRKPGAATAVNEQIHRSMADRITTSWTCKALKGVTLPTTADDSFEDTFKNRIRPWNS